MLAAALAAAALSPVPARADVRSGTWSARATLSSASYTQIYGVANVSANTNYVGSFWIKGSGSLTFVVNNPAWNYFPASTTVTATGTWTQVSLAFNSGSNTQMVLRLYDEVGNTSGSVMWIDDAFLGVSGGANLLSNPGFENGNTSWNVGTAFTIGQFGGPPLANGTYTLAPASATGLRLDVQGSGTANGTNVQVATANGGTNQQWILTNTTGNNYRLSPAHASAQCLDVSGQSTASGTNVQIWQYLSQANQQWAIASVSGGYTLTPTHALAMRLNATGTSSGSNVNQLTANSSNEQTWIIAPVGSPPSAPTLQTATPGNGQVALTWSTSSGATSYSVYRSTTANNPNPTLVQSGITSISFTDTGLTNGTTYYFKVTAINGAGASGFSNELNATPTAGGPPLANGTYTLAPANATGLRLDVQGSGTTNGTNVQIATANGGANQQWILTNTTGNNYRLSPAHASAQCLDVSGQSTASGTNVQIWQYFSQANQQWTITTVSGGHTLTPTHATAVRLNATGSSSGSNVNQLTANGSTAQTWVFTQVGSQPAVPALQTATPGSGQVALAWSVSTGATSYSVYRSTTANSPSPTLVQSGITSTSFTNTGLTNGTTYYFKVTATNSAGTSGFSNELSATPTSGGGSETVGDGTLGSPAAGPAASFGLGSGFTLVKNWNFGSSGTIKNMTDMDTHFQYHDHWNTIGNGANYGAITVASSASTAINDSTHGPQPYVGELRNGVPVPQVRFFSADSLNTFLVPLGGATTVSATAHNAGNGSFVAKWSLPNGGSLLNQDILWEVRVRYVTPPYFWFAIWTAGTQWNGGAEMDVMESFGYDNGGGYTNYDGRFWHSNSVGGNDTLVPNFLFNWEGGMNSVGIPTTGVNAWDGTEFHTWTWIYRKNNTYDVYMDGIRCQSGTINWTLSGGSGGTPINMFFLHDGGWGHVGVSSVNHSMPASNFDGTVYEWDYSRIYLRP